MDVSKHKAVICEGDMRKMYSSGVLGCESRHALLNKVFLEISLQFSRRGREGLRGLTKDAIEFKFDDAGREYATIRFL